MISNTIARAVPVRGPARSTELSSHDTAGTQPQAPHLLPSAHAESDEPCPRPSIGWQRPRGYGDGEENGKGRSADHSWALARLSRATVLLQLLTPIASFVLAPVRDATLRLVDLRRWIAGRRNWIGASRKGCRGTDPALREIDALDA